MNRVAIVGAGAWAPRLAIQAARAGNEVLLWSRTPLIGRVSPRLPGFVLPDAVSLVDEPPSRADVMVLAVPTQQLRMVARELRPEAPLLACCKGLETGTGRLPLEILSELHPGMPNAVLTGPNFAAGIAAGHPAASVVAASDAALRGRLVGLLGSPGFRLYGSADPAGAQLGGAAKNVIAIAGAR